MAAPDSKPPALRDRALQDLSFIRRTMEGASSFTDVPGWGLVATGVIALAAAFIADRQPSAARWLAAWIAAAVIAVATGGAAMLRKMRRRVTADSAQLISIPARRFLLGFWPAVFAGAVLTLALIDPTVAGIEARIADRLLPGLWLLLYGVGVTTAGAHSVRPVPMMGLAFIALGIVTLFAPVLDGDLMMALGFGVLQIGFGTVIARRHGG